MIPLNTVWRTCVASLARSTLTAILLAGFFLLCFSNHSAAEVVTNHAGLYGTFFAHNLGTPPTFFIDGDSGIKMDHSFVSTVPGAPWIYDTGELGGEIHGAGDQLFRLYAGPSVPMIGETPAFSLLE